MGVQFKKGGLTLGYLQLETPSMQMNNKSSNMFSENTFTYESSFADDFNGFMEKVHAYIVDRIESYKYGSPADEKLLYELVSAAKKKSGCHVNGALLALEAKAASEKEERAKEERERKERERLEAEQMRKENLRQTLQNIDVSQQVKLFVEQAMGCTRVMEIEKLWKSLAWEDSAAMEAIEKKISDAATIERLYGFSANTFNNLLKEIEGMI